MTGLLYWISIGLAQAAGLLVLFYLWKPDAHLWMVVRKRAYRGYVLGGTLLFVGLGLLQGAAAARNSIFSGWESATEGAASSIRETSSLTSASPASTSTPPPSPTRSPTSEPQPSPTSSPTVTPALSPTPTSTPDPLADPAACLPENALRQEAELVEILDGDTIRVRLEDGLVYQVRYLGMDTPERGELYCAETTHINEELLSSGPLVLVVEVSQTDRYDRLLRHVFAGDVFVNFEMIRLGFAHTMLISPDLACGQTFLTAEAAARQSSAGLWGLPTPTPTPLPTPTPPGAQAFTVISLSTPVEAGSYAALSIQAKPGSRCSLSYTTPAGTKSQAKGLGETAAGSSGVCSWSWFIGTGTRPGTGSLQVTADGYTKSLAIVITSP